MTAIGIDFGTENTGAFVEYGGSFRQIGAAAVDQKHLPSHVQYDRKGDMRAVGLPAKRGINDYKKMTVFNVKRLLGRRFDDKNIQNFKNVLDLNGNYEIVPDPDGQVQIVLGRTRLYPEDVASEIIATIIKDGLDQYPDLIIDHIVISVPAAYDAPQREMTKKAALLAIGRLRAKNYGERLQLPDFSSKKIDEIGEIQLVSEPTAALITYLAHRSKETGDLSPAAGNGTRENNKYVLIFDLGAGTLDITIGQIISVVNPFTGTDQPVIAIKKTHGNNFLGGRDMDDRLASWIEQKLIDQGRTVTPEIRFFIRENTEGIKIRLSERDSTRLTICDEGIDLPVTRTDLETAIRPLLDLLKTEIIKALAEAEITAQDLDFIIPVGGPTRMPCVKKILVDSSLPLFHLDTWDPMLAVAEGAARYATPDVNIEDKPGFDYCAAVEMFTNVLVPTAIINSNTDTVPIIKETDLIVRKPDSGVAEISICLVSRCNEGYKKINVIKIPTTKHGVTETKKLHYYSTLLNQYRDIEVHYGKIRMSWEITADGLLKKPAFTDPSTGISIDYPDIPIKDLGEIVLTNKKEYQENWEKYANEDAQAFEKGFNETIDRIQQAYPSLTRPQAIKLYIDEIRGFKNNNSFGKIREKTKERIAGARQAGVKSQLIDQWTSRLAAAQKDTEECRQELLGICMAIESIREFDNSIQTRIQSENRDAIENKNVKLSDVHFSITGPYSVAPGTSFILDIWAHLGNQRDLIYNRARQGTVDKKIMIKSVGPKKIQLETEITVRLEINGFEIDNSEQKILWTGETASVNYCVDIPMKTEMGKRVGKVKIFVQGMQIAFISFEILIDERESLIKSAPFSTSLYKTAFVSYASQDRDKVLARIQGIQKVAPNLEIKMDVKDIRSGDNWREKLKEFIEVCDIFYLFWSRNAKDSFWVNKEWKCAYKLKGIDFIDPIPLEPPTEIDPPQELSDKHFNDWVLAYMQNSKS